VNRRGVLASLAGVITTASAGCLGRETARDGDDPTTTPTGGPTATSTGRYYDSVRPRDPHPLDLRVENGDTGGHTLTVTIAPEGGDAAFERTVDLDAGGEQTFDGAVPDPAADVTYVATAEAEAGASATERYTGTEAHTLHALTLSVTDWDGVALEWSSIVH